MQIAARQLLWDEGWRASGRTVLVIRADADNMTVKLCTGSLAPGSAEVTVDWGDGAVERLPSLNGCMHAYARAREYGVKISDDLASFGYTSGNPGDVRYRDMLAEVVSVGRKVTSISGYGFNNCRNLRGVVNLPSVTSIGGYAFGSTGGITDFIFPSMKRLTQISFYCAPSPAQIHADNVTQIDAEFWEFYGRHLHDVYLRNSSCEQILAMGGFPFCAGPSDRFHGSDGIVLGNGTVIHN